MDSVVKDDMEKSNAKFEKIIAPYIISYAQKAGSRDEIIPVEYVRNSVCETLDQHAGIDYLYVYGELKRVFGIASRVQYGDNWRTFTIRYQRESGVDTEWKKRIDAIMNKGIFPRITIHSYLSEEDEVLGIGMIATKTLFAYMRDHKDEVRIKQSQDERGKKAWFAICRWDKLREHGYDIATYDSLSNSWS